MACFGAGAAAVAQGGWRIPRSALSLLMTLFWINAGLSIAWSEASAVSFMVFGTFCLLPVGFFAFSSFAVPAYVFKVGVCAVAAILAALSAWALLQYFFFTGFLLHGQVRHPFADPNAFAALLSLGFFPALGAMLAARDRRIANAALVLCSLFLGAIITIGSRGALIALALCTLFFLAVAREKIAHHKKCLTILVGVLIASIIAALAFSPKMQAPVERLLETGADAAADARLHLWAATGAMIRDHMPLGTGIGTFFLHYPQYRHTQEIHSGGFMVHSDPLQFAAEMGVIAPLLFYTLLLAAGLRMLRSWGRERDMVSLSVFCGLAALVLHSHVSFNFYVAPVLCLSGALLGWWHGRTGGPDEPSLFMGMKERFLAAGLVLAFLFLLQGIMIGERHVDKAYRAMESGDLDAFTASVERANRSAFGMNARAYVLAAAIPLGVLEAEGAALQEQERIDLVRQTESLLDRAEARNPRLVAVPYDRARLLSAQGKSPETELERALALNPLHLPARLMLADVLISGGKEDEAYAVLKDGLAWPYPLHDPRPYYTRLATLAAGRGEEEVAQAALEKLRRLRGPGLHPGGDPVPE